MTYQDKWALRQLLHKGTRECAERYKPVKDFCEAKFKGRPFTVCDIGSNMNYFGIRLTEDFPECRVMAFEFHEFTMRREFLEQSGATRVMLINRKVTAADLMDLSAFARFDLVLAMSVLHHVPGDFEEWLSAMKRLGMHLILELAGKDAKRIKPTNYRIPDGAEAVCIGVGRSHLSTMGHLHDRPILYMKGNQ